VVIRRQAQRRPATSSAQVHPQTEHPQNIALVLSHLNPTQRRGAVVSCRRRCDLDIALRRAILEKIFFDIEEEVIDQNRPSSESIRSSRSRAELAGIVRRRARSNRKVQSPRFDSSREILEGEDRTRPLQTLGGNDPQSDVRVRGPLMMIDERESRKCWPGFIERSFVEGWP